VTAATAVLNRYEKARPGAFIHSRDIPGTRAAVDTALCRLAASRPDLVRAARGVYWKGVKSRYGAGRPDPAAVAAEVARGRGLGPTGWAAANALGLSTQVPATLELTVVGAPPSGVDGVRFHSRNNTARTALSFAEVALLEVLRDDLRHTDTGWTELVERVRELVEGGKLHLKRVAKAVESERSPTARANFDRLAAQLAA
jgi:hypothetical protein